MKKLAMTKRRRPAFTIRSISRVHRMVYRLTGGRVLGTVLGVPVLLITTTGRRTGRPRTTPLSYVVDGGACVVTASFGGHPSHPAWYRNLRAEPVATIQVEGHRLRVEAETAHGADRERLWGKLVAMFSRYADYQARTAREIPVVILRETQT